MPVSLSSRSRACDGHRVAPSLGTVVDPFGLWSRAGLAALDRTLASPWAREALDAVLRSTLAEHAVRTVVEGPLGDAAARSAVRTGLLERVVVDLLETGAVTRILDRQELWLVIDEVVRSPEVSDAIAHQGAGFADQVAGEVGERSRRADARIERLAHRLLRRRTEAEDAALATTGPQ